MRNAAHHLGSKAEATTSSSLRSTRLMAREGSSHCQHRRSTSSAADAAEASSLAAAAPGETPTGLSFEEWLASVRKRSGRQHSTLGLSSHPVNHGAAPPSAAPVLPLSQRIAGPDAAYLDSALPQPREETQETSLFERLGRASILDINEFSWDTLLSLHHTKQTSSIENSEDEMSKSLEVTINSGGVVFYALFKAANIEGLSTGPDEAVAVIKFSTSRMATQSERLGYEFARLLGVQTPQARVVHNSSAEWQCIKDAAEKARDVAAIAVDEVGELTCTELLEALELSRCLYLMSYVHGSPLLENPDAFSRREAAEIIAAALGRVLMLDLVVTNEDRLPCRQLGWRGNPANLLFTNKQAHMDPYQLENPNDSPPSGIFRHQIIRSLQKERRSNSVDGGLGPSKPRPMTPNSRSYVATSHIAQNKGLSDQNKFAEFHIVAIDSGVPRRPPAGKRAKDEECYPKVVELMLNSSEFAANLLYEVSGFKLGFPSPEEDSTLACPGPSLSSTDMVAVIHEFRRGFRAALRDLQSFHIFLLTLHQKLEGLLNILLLIIDKSSETDRCESGASDSPSHFRPSQETLSEYTDYDTQKSVYKAPIGIRDIISPLSCDNNLNGRHFKSSGVPLRCPRIMAKLRDFNKFGKIDAELNKELEQWNEILMSDVIKMCQDNHFNTGFFEGNDYNATTDAYELKVRLEHTLERIALISEAASTERPSSITGSLFIGGALAARSLHTLRCLGITHILCLCSHEIGQSESQYPELFDYQNFSIDDNEDENIAALFTETSSYLDGIERSGGKILVHCFEGRSRSATVVLAYLMMRKGLTLREAWNMLKKVHRRAQPNNGFARALVDLDKQLHGKASMEWLQRKPAIKGLSVAP